MTNKQTPPPGSFVEFFGRATRSADHHALRQPYPFQRKFAEAPELHHIVRAPTGSGKTATAILGWLWRLQSHVLKTPRRLVYCLPMRVLVEQTVRESRAWLTNLQLDIPVYTLMGGVDCEAWYLYPERPAILIGTQDMVLSRALNRGYAASRFHWPIDFGLMNNDCLWVFDEPQLMATGVTTSAQLAGLRGALGTFAACPSVWMSATLEPTWLDTIDFKDRRPALTLELTTEDYVPATPLHKRMTAVKTVHELGEVPLKDSKAVARAILDRHIQGTQTIAVLNTVERAKALYSALETLRKKAATPSLLLVHSRFRPGEREELNRQLQDTAEAATNRIVIATQVVEAGVDISARTLITELAPWASIVQRAGRCNRTGDDGPGRVYWLDVDEKAAPPYTPADLSVARDALRTLESQGISPRELNDFAKQEAIVLPLERRHVLRRRDLLDLFDTAPDLSGNDIDIQRFVRSDDPDLDLHVFWRAISEDGPEPDEPSPHRRELCAVPVAQVRRFLESATKKRKFGYLWDHIDNQWIRAEPRRLRPGLTLLLPVEAGGYTETLGWDSDSTAGVTLLTCDEKIAEEMVGTDSNSASASPATISEHTQRVCAEMSELLDSLPDLSQAWRDILMRAACWHDAGKAHSAFQAGMRSANSSLDPRQLWAKSGSRTRLQHGRKHFRHELVSALAAWQHALPFAVAYLVAAHHGRPRLAIRALPGEDEPTQSDLPFALGVHHGDMLPEISLTPQETCPPTVLDLSPAQLGGDRSWAAHALRLVNELGPFRLAYLESLLRAADCRTSRKEANGG